MVVAIVFTAIPFLSQPQTIHASSSDGLTLSPTAQTTTVGSNLVVTISITTGGDSINTVQSVVTYDASKYSLVGVSPGATFGSFPNTTTSNSISFSAATATPVTGTQTVATVTLHAIAVGTSQVTLASVCPPGNYALTCSAAYDSSTSDNDLATVTGGTYIVATAPAQSASTGSTTGSSRSSSAATTPTTAKPAAPSSSSTSTTTPPVISVLTVSAITANSAVISWQTNLASTSVVKYGLTGQYGLTAQDSSLVTSHRITLDKTYLTQGNKYYFVVSDTTADGAQITSSGQAFSTVGFDVTLTILDSHKKPIKNATVVSSGQKAVTNSDGVAILHNMPAGVQSVTIKSGNASTQDSVTIGKLNPATGNYELQSFVLTATPGLDTTTYIIIALIALFLAILTILMARSTRIRLLWSKYVRHDVNIGTDNSLPLASTAGVTPIPPPLASPSAETPLPGSVVMPSPPPNDTPPSS
jgi:hypothetical protein